MDKKRGGKRLLAVAMSFIMTITLLFTNGTMVKADGGQKSIIFTKRASNGVNGTISYKSDEDWVEITEWDNGSFTLQLDASVMSVAIKAVPSEGGYINQSTSRIGDRNIDSQDALNLKSESGHTVNFGDATSINVEIEFDNNSGQTQNPSDPGQDNPQPGPGISEDFAVKIGGTTVYQASAAEGAKINVPNDALYSVEETRDGIAIKPNKGTDANHNPEADITTKQSLTLDPISVTGSGKVEVHAGLNYTPTGVVDGSHIEEDVPIIIKASETTGYSFEADGDVDFHICGGNFRSTVKLEGGIKTRGFTLNDLKSLTIGISEKPVNQAFCAPLRNSGGQNIVYESSYVEFNLAKINIYANKAFTNYKEIRAWDEAAVTVKLSGETPTMFDNVNVLQVQNGGKFNLTSTSAITVPSKVQSGYYTEIGQILRIPDDGRFQDAVNVVDCQKGDFTNQKGRYKYTISEDNKNVVLESTTNTLWALGYSFLPDSGNQYVEHGHFEISAGSGLVREDTTDGGEYWFEAGTEVIFKLVPDTGYRYKEGTFAFNGDASARFVTATDEPGVYIFTMQSNPIHVSCEFEKAEDEIDVTSSNAVSTADINVPNGTINGVAEFGVVDKELTPEQEAEFANVAQDMVLDTALDLSMNEVIDKIGAEGSWVTPVTELTSPMEVTLGLDSSLGGYEDYIVVRQHGEEIERLETEYDANTNSVTFETDRYSTYVIAHSENKVHVHTLISKNAKAATCTEAGNTEYYTCSSCGKYYSDAAGTTEIAANSWILPKKGHSLTKISAVAATCTAAGNSEYYTCSGCGKYYSDAAGTTEIAANSWVISALGHDNQSKIVPATTSKDGYTADVCSRCGEESNKVTISAIKTITLKSTSVTYTGKTLKTAVTVKDKKGKTISSKYYTVSYKNNKNVGKATVTIRFKGNYRGTVKKTFNIVPKATTISKVTAAKKGFKVTWKKQTTQTTGYEIQYSTDKNFKKAVKTVTISKNKTTSKSITKLAAKKKYYVRIRTYKLVGKTKYYSGWSKISNVTTKK